MQGLACTCGTCAKEPIDECACESAAKMRGEVKERLRGVDLSTAGAREEAYKSVRAGFAVKYGDAVLTPRLEAKTDPRLNWLPIIVFAGGVLLFANVTRKSLRRRRDERRG